MAGYTPFSLFLPTLGSECRVCCCLDSNYVDCLHNIVAFVEKNTRKLKEIHRQRGEITRHQKHRYKKGDRIKIDDILVMVFGFVLLLVTLWIACFPITILELYYGVFKQVRKYYCLKQQLKSV